MPGERVVVVDQSADESGLPSIASGELCGFLVGDLGAFDDGSVFSSAESAGPTSAMPPRKASGIALDDVEQAR